MSPSRRACVVNYCWPSEPDYPCDLLVGFMSTFKIQVFHPPDLGYAGNSQSR